MYRTSNRRFADCACLSFMLAALIAAPSHAQGDHSTNLKKLDPNVVLGLKHSRGELVQDKPTLFIPGAPVRIGDSVVLDLDATVSDDLLRHIVSIGGTIARGSPDPSHIVRATIPLSQVEALADRADIKSISPARIIINSRPHVAP